jgi:hypothetical protein
MSLHDSAKFQQFSVIFANSAADTKNRMFFRDSVLSMVDTVTGLFKRAYVSDPESLTEASCPKCLKYCGQAKQFLWER